MRTLVMLLAVSVVLASCKPSEHRRDKGHEGEGWSAGAEEGR